jgi:hypothetical protein
VAMANRAGYCQGTQPDYDRGLKNFRSAPKDSGIKLGALPPNPRFGGNSKSWRPWQRARAQNRSLTYLTPATKFNPFRLWSGARPERPVGRLGALIPLGRCVSCIIRCQHLTCRIGGCLVQASNGQQLQEETLFKVINPLGTPLTQKRQLRCSAKDEKPLTRFSAA